MISLAIIIFGVGILLFWGLYTISEQLDEIIKALKK
jgi:hypothetical protein